jgi:hypothetical protein
VVPGPAGEVPRRYLQALVDTGIPTLAIPIGGAFVGGLPPEWRALSGTFITDLEHPYVNIVCAPPGLLMGSPLRASDMQLSAPERAQLVSDGLNVPPAPVAQGAEADELIYVPQTALSGLYTVGVPNIAITDTRPKPPDAHEIRALAQYDRVCCHSQGDWKALTRLGVEALLVPPLARSWRAILRELEP